MPKTTSRAKAEAHEALFLRLAAALAQVVAIAARHPEAAVPEETRAIAEVLLYDSRPFTPSSSFSLAPPAARRAQKRASGESLPSARSGGGAAKALGRDPGGRVRGLPAAAGTLAALATQLGQARAALEMWEAEHSGWNGVCYVWRLTRVDELPIQRLRAKAKPAAADPDQRRQFEHVKEMLWKRIDARFGEGYDAGYADARQGLSNRREESYPRRASGD